MPPFHSLCHRAKLSSPTQEHCPPKALWDGAGTEQDQGASEQDQGASEQPFVHSTFTLSNRWRQTSGVPHFRSLITAPGYCLISNTYLCSDHWQSGEKLTLSNARLCTTWEWLFPIQMSTTAKLGTSETPVAWRDQSRGYFPKYKTKTLS